MFLFCFLSLQVHVSFPQHGDKDPVYSTVPQRGAEGGGVRVPGETPVPADLATENHHSRKWLQKHDESPAFTHRNHQVCLSWNINQREAPCVLLNSAFTKNLWSLNVFLKQKAKPKLYAAWKQLYEHRFKMEDWLWKIPENGQGFTKAAWKCFCLGKFLVLPCHTFCTLWNQPSGECSQFGLICLKPR